jgi:hypothetical protein
MYIITVTVQCIVCLLIYIIVVVIVFALCSLCVCLLYCLCSFVCCMLCLIVVPLPQSKNPFAFKINNNNLSQGGGWDAWGAYFSALVKLSLSYLHCLWIHIATCETSLAASGFLHYSTLDIVGRQRCWSYNTGQTFWLDRVCNIIFFLWVNWWSFQYGDYAKLYGRITAELERIWKWLWYNQGNALAFAWWDQGKDFLQHSAPVSFC